MGRIAVNPILDTQITCVLSVDTMRKMIYWEGSGQPHSEHTDNLCNEFGYYENNHIWEGCVLPAMMFTLLIVWSGRWLLAMMLTLTIVLSRRWLLTMMLKWCIVCSGRLKCFAPNKHFDIFNIKFKTGESFSKFC